MNRRHTRRAWWHDYRSRSIYLITINKRKDGAPFGVLCGDWRVPVGFPGSPYVQYSETGKILSAAMKLVPDIFPNTRLLQYIIMPDHIHILIHVMAETPEPLGRYVSKFKNTIRTTRGVNLFEKGFNDKILTMDRSLDDIYNYIRENPYRLAIRRAKPDNFVRCDNIIIRGKRYSGYGNLFLLKNPFKEQVVIHRRSSESEKAVAKARMIHDSLSGAVLVSPFISKDEKEVRENVEKYGGGVILIVDEPLPPPPYKPYGRNFLMCERGELLILAPYESSDKRNPDMNWKESKEIKDEKTSEGYKYTKKKPITREACLQMNDLAHYICSREFNSKQRH